MTTITEPIERVRRRLRPSPSGCLEWQGGTSRGYGSVRLPGGRHAYAHRIAYEAAHGPIADGLCVLHRCDNPRCCNPDHLFLGTRTDNHLDKMAKGRGTPPPRFTGEAHHGARLTETQVRTIRRRHACGETGADIARELGLSRSTVNRAINGQTWRAVA